jgi:glyoxylase-like metal-dependent hydrolase (beta-lactamase superfamily II)
MALESRSLHLGPLDNNTYLLTCPVTRETAVIDVGFEPEAVIERIRRDGLRVRWLLGTHAHYDHVAGMLEVQRECGGEYALHPLDRPLLEALPLQASMYGFPRVEPPEVAHDLADGERIPIGEQELEVLFTPGHAPGHCAFLHGGTLWTGDVLFAGSVGRTDLPGGDFEALHRSIKERLFALGDEVRFYPGHGPAGTIGEERRSNPFVGESPRRSRFI